MTNEDPDSNGENLAPKRLRTIAYLVIGIVVAMIIWKLSGWHGMD
jgi:hypothetical protein